ncbi:receptor expression-enhancing protein 2 isoform X2 [Chanos chanos]|uniref:Receptor expression-enhancing protein n=1 Tax=Chanos chanos TaxID=29144 RepID=A0A6J2VTL1_CHACN|nr:receptor expression-enhancing protein 2 isoform X2 [Chanos chanos]
MVSWIISRMVVLAFGTLYPAYSSYKAVKTKNVKEYVKWMMYWIVFAFFTTAETITDLVLSWFPFYFELKIAFVIWLLSPYTKGSSVLYRKFVHPTLSNREKEIDEYITQAKDRSYETMMRFGKRGLNLAANAAVTAAAKGQGVLSEKLRSFSMQDLTLIGDEEELHLRGAELHLRGTVPNLLDSTEDIHAGVNTTSADNDSQHSPRTDGDQSDGKTEHSDEDFGEKVLKRTSSVKAVKKPASAKTETTKTLKKQPKKKSTVVSNNNAELP